jgi:hypothetical protein
MLAAIFEPHVRLIYRIMAREIPGVNEILLDEHTGTGNVLLGLLLPSQFGQDFAEFLVIARPERARCTLLLKLLELWHPESAGVDLVH